MMKRLLVFMMILFPVLCLAQQDSMVVNVRGVDFVMMKIPKGVYEHVNYYGDTMTKEGRLLPIDSMGKKDGTSTIYLDAFYIGKFEVTQKLYYAVMKDNPSYWRNNKCPVNNITWYDACIFIDSLNNLTGMTFRLPTEMEWEYAASGGIDTRFSGSDMLEAVAWTANDGYPFTFPVGMKSPNAFGLYDMSGNVAEWCNDWLSTTYYKNKGSYKAPHGPESGIFKIKKGGGWGNHATRYYDYRNRVGKRPDHKGGDTGFRLAMDAK